MSTGPSAMSLFNLFMGQSKLELARCVQVLDKIWHVLLHQIVNSKFEMEQDPRVLVPLPPASQAKSSACLLSEKTLAKEYV